MNNRLPKRYRFSNHQVERREPAPLPVEREQAANLPLDQRSEIGLIQPIVETSTISQAPQVIHIHHAPPDRVVQRLALGAGMGAGTVAAAVYFAPLLIAMVQSLVLGIISLTVALAVAAWAINTVVGFISGKGRR